ncbi:MAG: transcriptional repressor [Myxococcota bacterium]
MPSVERKKEIIPKKASNISEKRLELRELEDFLEKRGLRLTKRRFAIFQALLNEEGHLTAEELHAKLKDSYPRLGSATVYRALKLLVASGIVAERRFGEAISYEFIREGAHHDHFICVNCGAVIEFENSEIERLQEEEAKKIGFGISSHHLDVFGVCKKCSKG